MKIRSLPVQVAAMCALLVIRLVAQDVTVSEPVWFSSEPAPEVLPKPKSRLRPDYPDELRPLGEIGYVIVSRYVDASGKSLAMAPGATHTPFQRAVEVELRDWQMSPAKRGGQPIDARVWIAVIFNPKSAATKGPNATPRLLALTPVMMKNRPASPIVSVRLSVDETGAITAAEPMDELPDESKRAIQDALKKWRFAPARQDGRPVAAEVVVPVLCQRLLAPDLDKRVPPKLVKRVEPEYPRAMRNTGLRGEVKLAFEVDPEGKVQNPVVLASSNPAFNEPAIASVHQSKFRPGTQDGKPVKSRMQLSIIFAPRNGGVDPYQIREKDQSKLPEEWRFDTPAKIRGTLVPVYPYALRKEGVRGTAKGVMMIDTSGRVFAVKITEADRPEFGHALTAALEGFTFDPALKDGKPVIHALTYEQRFDFNKLPDRQGDDLLSLEKKHPEKILGAGALDEPLKPISRRSPVLPTAEEATTGEAVIEVLIDKEGQAQLPRIVSATAPAFGYAAVQAAAAWQFERPLVGGKPVVVRVQLPFRFAERPFRKY